MGRPSMRRFGPAWRSCINWSGIACRPWTARRIPLPGFSRRRQWRRIWPRAPVGCSRFSTTWGAGSTWADAWDDLAEDQRTGNYNPLLARFGDQAAASKESLRETMRVSLGLANTAFSLLDWGEWEPLLGHILGTGLPAVEEAVFTGQWKQRKRPFHHHQGSAPAAVPTNKEKETYE